MQSEIANDLNRRKLIQLTMRPELYARIKQHCDDREIPVAVWARELFRQELDRLDASAKS